VAAIISLQWVRVLGWALGAASAGVAVTGVEGTGAVIIGTAAIGIAIGTTIMATMSSLSVASGFRGGGVGVRPGVGTGAIHTDTTVTATRTGMVLPTATVMATDTEAPPTAILAMASMGTAADRESPSYSAGSLAPAITTVPLTASWDRRRDEQSERTNRTTGTQVNLVFQ